MFSLFYVLKTSLGFIQGYFLSQDHDMIGSINSPVYGSENKTGQSCSIYKLRIHPDLLIVSCKKDCPIDQAYSIVDQVFDYIWNS